MLALNNTWLPSNNTVLTLRYGLTKFIDDNTLSIDFDPATLGFSSTFLDQTTVDKYPQVRVTEYGDQGAIDPTPRNWYSWSANGTYTRLAGKHTLKAGGDYRLIGIETQSFGGSAGFFYFDRYFTSSNPLTQRDRRHDAVGQRARPRCCSAIPRRRPPIRSRGSYLNQTSPFDAYVHYFGGYAQDDWRLSPKTTINLGVRLEHETGLAEKNNGFTVAFDRTLNPGGALGNVVNPQTGQPIRGGLVYAGVNGANEYQGNPPGMKFSPRLGFVHSFNPRTVLRAGYGIYWAPWNYQAVGAANYGNIGFSQQTFISQNQFRPSALAGQSVPERRAVAGGQPARRAGRRRQPDGVHRPGQEGALGAAVLGGHQPRAGRQHGRRFRVLRFDGPRPGSRRLERRHHQHQPGAVAVPGAWFGAARPGAEPVLRLAERRHQRRVVPAGQERDQPDDPAARAAAALPAVQRHPDAAGHLRESQYHAAIFKFEKRMSNGWGGRINYTYSRLEDNQFGEDNFFAGSPGFVGAVPSEMANVDITQDDYGVDAEYGIGLLDVPHKLVFSPIAELPFGEGKRWLNGGIGNILLGDWTVSSIISIESGFPLTYSTNTNTSNIFTRVQRPNGTPTATDGSRHERIAPPQGSACTSDCGTGQWLTQTGLSTPANFTLGTMPRTDDSVRTPHRNNWDFVATKGVRFGDSRVRAQLRLEVLNLTNTVKVRSPDTRVDRSTFGQIRTQGGFQRLTQIMFRVTF